MRIIVVEMWRLVLLVTYCGTLLLSADVTVTGEPLYKVSAIASRPFICSDMDPCKPFTPLSKEFFTESDQLQPGQCLHGGVRSKNGFCVHGLLVDLVTYLRLNSSAIMPFELWYTDSSVVGGHNNFVRETSQPGYLKSIGRLSACQNGRDSNGDACAVAPHGSDAGITWDYICGDSPCDLAIGDITINWFRKRVLGAKFTLPFMDVGLKVVTRALETDTVSKFSNFLDPFTPGLWWCWIGFMFFSAIAFAIIEDPSVRGALFSWCMGGDLAGSDAGDGLVRLLDKNGDGVVSVAEKAGQPMFLLHVCALVLTTCCPSSPFFAVDTDHVETKLGRTYLIGWLVVNFILTASYTASLTSFLVENKVNVALPRMKWQEVDAWRSLPESLEACYKEKATACLATSLGGNTEGVLKGFLRTDPAYFRNQISDPSLTARENFDLILQNKVDGVVAWAQDETTIDYALLTQDLETQCRWVQVGETFATGSFGMVVGPSLPNEVFVRVNQQLDWAKQDKSLDGLKNVWYASARQCFDERSETSALEPQDFGFLFIVVPAIAMVSIIWRVSRQWLSAGLTVWGAGVRDDGAGPGLLQGEVRARTAPRERLQRDAHRNHAPRR
eukprot:2631849-Rhodomonas_salina.2